MFEVGRTYRTRGGSGTVTVVGLEANGTFRCDDGFWRNGDGSFSRFTVDPRDLLPGAIEDAGSGENDRLLGFVEQILHGDDNHRAWLKDAARAFLAGLPVPVPYPAPEPDTKWDRDARAALTGLLQGLLADGSKFGANSVAAVVTGASALADALAAERARRGEVG
jgi:hypothetical protein